MKVNIFFLFLFFIMMINILVAQEKEKLEISFDWAFLYNTDTVETGIIDPDERLTELVNGNRFRIYLKPIENAYIYLFYCDTEGDLSLLFPQEENDFFSDYKIGKYYYLPSSDKWWRLKPPSGTEEFHLVVTKEPQEDLHTLIKTYSSLKNKKTDEEKIDDARQDILDKIKALKNEVDILTGINIKPTPIAGVVRAIEDEEEISGFNITVKNVYAKTIRIKH